MNKATDRKTGFRPFVICVFIAALICSVLSGYSIYRISRAADIDDSYPTESALRKVSDKVGFNVENCGEIYLLTGHSMTLVDGCVSSDENIASCAGDVVTANNPGSTRISTLTPDAVCKYWTLNVSNYEDIILPIVKTHQLSTIAESTGWNCSNTSIATVDESGLIKPRKVGSCVISGSDVDGRQYAYNVSVKKTAYITIDDWPGTPTLSMLDVLDKYNIKATFFLCAQDTGHSIYRKIIESGHAIGNHTYSHEISYLYKKFRNMCSSVYTMDEWLQKNFSVKTKLVRYPGGYSAKNSAQRISFEKLTKRGYRIFDWTCALGDTKYTKPEDLMYNLKRLLKDNVEIILMHNKKHTAAVFEQVVLYILEQDYVCLPLDEQSPTYDFIHKWDYS